MISINYYNEIKNTLIANEIYCRVKDYSKNKAILITYYKVDKILFDAGKHYGEGIIKEYAMKLEQDIDKKYDLSVIKRMRQFYQLIQKGALLAHQLSWSHYIELLPIKDVNEVNYYINISVEQYLSRNKLRERIKAKEYQRLDSNTKLKLINQEELSVTDFIKEPIVLNKNKDYDKISEKILKEIIMNDLSNFLKQLGNGFTYIDNEYRIKMCTTYNYIDILLFNIIFNCYVVVELKTHELKKEDIGQIQVYMNYIDKHIKSINHNKTIGIIICKKDNKLVLEYSSDSRIYSTEYILI